LPEGGISVWGKTNATLRGNKIIGCSQGGFTASFTDLTTLHDVLIEDNTLSGNCRVNAEHKTLGGWPASLSVGGTRCTVRGNLVERGHAEGIAVGGGLNRTRFERNTFVDGSVELLHLDPSAGHVDNVFADNRCVQTVERPVVNTTSIPPGFCFSNNRWLGLQPPPPFVK